MGRDLLRCDERARALVPEAEDVTGLPIAELMSRADAATIADPEIAQVLVFVASGVMHRQLTDRGWRPDVVAGHSLGEYSALVASGVLGWIEALTLVAARGRAMAAAARQATGTMAAIVGLPVEAVAALCAEVSTADGPAVLANLNSARQAVVSGTADAVAAVVERARAAGALRAKLLPVGGAYHSPLMAPARDELRPLVEAARLTSPRTALISSVTGQPVHDLAAYRADLAGQITSPVRWQATVAALAGSGVRRYVEVGPGRVLSGLGREAARDATHLTAADALRTRSGSPAVAS